MPRLDAATKDAAHCRRSRSISRRTPIGDGLVVAGIGEAVLEELRGSRFSSRWESRARLWLDAWNTLPTRVTERDGPDYQLTPSEKACLVV